MQTFCRSPHKWGSPCSLRRFHSELANAPAINQHYFLCNWHQFSWYVWYVIVWDKVCTCGALMCADVWMVRFSQEVQTLRPGIVWSRLTIGIRLSQKLPPGGWRSRREPWHTAPLVQRCLSLRQSWIITFCELDFLKNWDQTRIEIGDNEQMIQWYICNFDFWHHLRVYPACYE